MKEISTLDLNSSEFSSRLGLSFLILAAALFLSPCTSTQLSCNFCSNQSLPQNKP